MVGLHCCWKGRCCILGRYVRGECCPQSGRKRKGRRDLASSRKAKGGRDAIADASSLCEVDLSSSCQGWWKMECPSRKRTITVEIV